MKSQSAKVTTSETTSVCGKRKFNFLYCGNTAVFFIHRMIIFHIRKCIHFVKLVRFKRWHRRILYKIFVTVLLHECFSYIRILLIILQSARYSIFTFTFYTFFITRNKNGIVHHIQMIYSTFPVYP